jgi:hypothetical protein
MRKAGSRSVPLRKKGKDEHVREEDETDARVALVTWQ